MKSTYTLFLSEIWEGATSYKLKNDRAEYSTAEQY